MPTFNFQQAWANIVQTGQPSLETSNDKCTQMVAESINVSSQIFSEMPTSYVRILMSFFKYQ